MEKITAENLNGWRMRWVNAGALSLSDIMALAGETMEALGEGWVLCIKLYKMEYDTRIYDSKLFDNCPSDKAVAHSRRMEDGIADAFLRMLFFFAETKRIDDGIWK